MQTNIDIFTLSELLTLDQIHNWFVYDPEQPLLFTSGLFLGVFIVFYFGYHKIKNIAPLRVWYVVAFSLFFYYKSSGLFFLLLLVSAIVDFIVGLELYKNEDKSHRKTLLAISLIVNLGLLGYFKYANFFIDNANYLLHRNFNYVDLVLPVGISFYTFQTLSYTIDIYRNKLAPTHKFMDFLFFVSFFPQLVAGPIVRAKHFLPQLVKNKRVTNKDFNWGLFLIIGGVIKKAVISDFISVNFVDRVFDAPNQFSGFENLMASYGYAIQIYCDFSGYSDIAIGLALLLGFRLPPNFRTPYQSGSITEFWRRWHISLSLWLKDYLYISLGGNRHGKWHTFLNVMITMLLGGLWHGASWKFVFWGFLHGLALVIEKALSPLIPLPKNYFTRALQVIVTFHFVVFCWIFFRAADINIAFQMLQNIRNLSFDLTQWTLIVKAYQNVFILLFIGFIWHFIPVEQTKQFFKSFSSLPLPAKALVLAFVYWLVYATTAAQPQPFIYFKF